MSNEVALFEGKTGLPAHLADLNETGNIVVRETVPQLSFRGKAFRVVISGDETIIVNKEGDPVQSVKVIVLEYNKDRSRAYFKDAYVEGKSTAPTCWSHDGKVPDPTGAEVQAETCASCPQSVKGSRVTPDGKQVTACAQFKRAALVPFQDPGFQPLLLKLPQTSMWDKDAEEMAAKGQYAFDQYVDMLRRKGVKHTALVVTKIGFDPRASYPKLLFSAVDWTPDAMEQAVRAQLAKKDALDTILNVTPDAQAVEPTTTNSEGETAASAPAAGPKPTAPKATAPKPTAPKASAAKPPATPPVDPDEPAAFGKTATPPAANTAAPPPAAAVPTVPAGTPVSAGLKNLMSTWDTE